MSADRMTPEQFAGIAARAEAATPGPWGVYESGGLIDIAADLQETGCGYRARREIARLEEEPLDNDATHREWTAEEDWAQIQADAEFTAHAREDIPALLAEVDRLRGALREACDHVAEQDDKIGELSAENHAARQQAPVIEAGFEYGIRVPDGEVLDPRSDRADTAARLIRYRDCWPDAVMVQRTVHRGPWQDTDEIGGA